MTEEKLVELGYLPKELPPGFISESLARNLAEIKSRWLRFENSEIERNDGESRSVWSQRKADFYSKYGSSQCVDFSISKGKLARRVLKLPNPKHFITVSELISSNWEFFLPLFDSSPFSMSFPVEETEASKRAVKTYSSGVPVLRNEILKRSVRKLIQVRVDISKFYPTIYTHTIPWSILGKETAKRLFKLSKAELSQLISEGNSDAISYAFADKLDSAIRSCQDRQSIGVPIGPDTSHIVAELIACRIDGLIQLKLNELDIEAVRFYDDYYIFVNTFDEADKVVKGLQLILNEYQLEINDKKIEINEFPFSFEDEWVTALNQFEFKETNQQNSLKHYFSLIWDIGSKHKSRTDWVFKYALKTFEYRTVEINRNSWELFEDLLFKTSLIQPAILDITTRILLSYREYINDESIRKLTTLVRDIIKIHASVNHNFEVSWALWLAKSFNIQISEETANSVIDTRDDFSILILLCMLRQMELVQGNPNFENIEATLQDDVLFSPNWLLAYESVKKGWLNPAEKELIENNGFFKILSDLDISFFNCELQLTTMPKRERTEQTVDNYETTEESNENGDLDENEVIYVSGIL